MGKRTVAFVQQTTVSAAIPVGQGRNSVATVAIVKPGLGYLAGDILTVSGGTEVAGFKARLLVKSVDQNGGILAVDIHRDGNGQGPGWYTTNPTNPVSHTGGTGSGATFTLTYNSNVPPPGANSCTIEAEAQVVRYRGDGVAPTATIGEQLLVKAAGVPPLELVGVGAMRNMQFIEAVGGAKLDIEFFKN